MFNSMKCHGRLSDGLFLVQSDFTCDFIGPYMELGRRSFWP